MQKAENLILLLSFNPSFMNDKPREDNKLQEKAGLFIPAGLFIGMGIGFFIGQLVGGIFIGLGAGFLLMAIANVFKA